MREKDYYGAIKGFCLKWNLPEVWNSDRITGANLIYEVIKVINAMILEQKEVKEMVEDFLLMFNEDLSDTVKDQLTTWLNDGTLGDIINETLFDSKLDITDFETYKSTTETSLERIEQKTLKYLDVTKPPFNMVGGFLHESDLFQSALDFASDNNMILYIPKGVTITVEKMTVTDKSNFGIRIDGVLKRKNGYAGVGGVISFNNCSDVRIENINIDGNAFNNGTTPDSDYVYKDEHSHGLIFTGCSDIKIDKFHILNSMGDGIYITGKSKRFDLGTIKAVATELIGRNIVSIIDATDIFIDNIFGKNFGHRSMPGGLDLEPNEPTEIIKNIYINNINIQSGGVAPLAILASHGGKCSNVFIGKVYIDNLNTVSNAFSSVLIWGSDVIIDSLIIDGNDTGVGLKINNEQGSGTSRVTVKDMITKNNYVGLEVGLNGICSYLDIKGKILNSKRDGCVIHGMSYSKLDLDINNVGTNRYYMNVPATHNVAANIFSGDFTKRGGGSVAVVTSAVSTSLYGNTFENLSFEGWGVDNRLVGKGWLGNRTLKVNCKNLTDTQTYPNSVQTPYNRGDIVWNLGTGNNEAFWKRITNGVSNVLDVDWKGY